MGSSVISLTEDASKPVKQAKNGGTVRKNRGQFPRGVSGNPRGRPRTGHFLGEVIRKYLAGKYGKTNQTRLQKLLQRLYLEDPKTLLAYGYGKPVETVQMQGNEDQPVEFIVRVNPEDLP